MSHNDQFLQPLLSNPRDNMSISTPQLYRTRMRNIAIGGFIILGGLGVLVPLHNSLALVGQYQRNGGEVTQNLASAHIGRIVTTGRDNVRAAELATTNSPTDQDEKLRTGVLPNGMHYYVQRNPTPTHRAMLWLAVNAGAIQEDDDQQGFAHFVEHMAFNGTRRFPGNSLIDMVERAGLNFGADLNAYTSFDQTVYQLSMPTDSAASLQQALDIVEDWAGGGITLDSAAVVGERGVVLGEWRQRIPDTLSERLQHDMLALELGDSSSRYLRRFPIGLPALLRDANPAPIRRFYHDWYRPDLMAVIAVGDFDPTAMERTIKARFSKIPARANPRLFTRPVVSQHSTTVVHVVRDLVNPSVTVAWPMPIVDGDAERRVSQEITEELLASYFQQTLGKLTQLERRPFAAFGFGIGAGSVRAVGRQLTLALRMSPDSTMVALSTALGELERVAQHGLAPSELETQKLSLLRQWEQAADATTAVQSRALAEVYVSHYLTGNETLLSPVQRLAIAQKIVPGITTERVQKAAQFWRASAGRVVTVHIPSFASVRPPTSEEILAVLDSVRQVSYAAWPSASEYIPGSAGSQPTTGSSTAIGSPATGSIQTGLATTAPPPSNTMDSANPLPSSSTTNQATNHAIVAEQYDTASGITTWTLSNGARVVYKPTRNNSDELIIEAKSPGGYALLPDSLFYSSGRLVADLITTSGSFGNTTHDQFVKTLQTTGLQQLRVAINAFDEMITVAGSPKELNLVFQTLHRQFTEPTVDTTALAEWRRTGMSSIAWSPNDRIAYANSGDRRLAPPSVVNVPFMDMAQGMAVFRDRFGDASDFTFYIVGAAPADQIKSLLAKYVATLPSTHRTTHEQPHQVKVRLQQQTLMARDSVPQLKAEQAMASLGYMGKFTDSATTFVTERSRLNALSWILSRRLRIRLREEMSVTYGASAQASFFYTPNWYYQLGIQFMTSPTDMDASVKAMWEELNALRTAGPSREELALVAEIQHRQKENAQQNNRWWITQMQLYDALGIPLATLGATTPPSFTAEEIVAAAHRYMPEDRYVQRVAFPTKKTIDNAKKDIEQKKGNCHLRCGDGK